MPIGTPVTAVSPTSAHRSDASSNRGQQDRSLPNENGRAPIDGSEKHVLTDEDFDDVLTPGSDFADIEGGEFSGDIRPSNDALGGTQL